MNITSKNSEITGMVHSLETMGAVDGPGIRTVVFLRGCPLRCGYCSNKDMVEVSGNEPQTTPASLLKQVLPYKSYFEKHGGITVSGGDPVYQPEFVLEFLKLCKEKGIHTALDTSLFTEKEVLERFVKYVDLFMISLKHFDTHIHEKLTSVSNISILENIKYLNDIIHSDKLSTKIWFRFVVLPGYTDTNANIEALINFLHTVHFELIELLPYHTLGMYKWKELGISYPLKEVPLPKQSVIDGIKKRLEHAGFKVQTYE